MANAIKLLTRHDIFTKAQGDDKQVCLSSSDDDVAQDLTDFKTALGLSSSDLSDVATLVKTSGDQTIAGVKTFSGKQVYTAGRQSAYVAKTATYPIVAATDYMVNCTSGTFTVTLPTAVGIAGQEFHIKNSGNGNITVATTSSQTIDEHLSGAIILPQYTNLSVMSDGANWIIL